MGYLTWDCAYGDAEVPKDILGAVEKKVNKKIDDFYEKEEAGCIEQSPK